jgi:maltose alpha-D-glucosyltransferase / alpha-amylase
VLPVISQGKYSYKHLNVAEQRRDLKSLLSWMERAIRMRKECPEFGWGTWQIIDTGNPSVFAHRSSWRGGVVIAVHNLAQEACAVTLKLNEDDAKHLIELLGDQPYQPREGALQDIQLEGYGFRWFRVGGHHL